MIIGKGNFGLAILSWKKITKKPELKIDQTIYRDSPFYSSKKSQDGSQSTAQHIFPFHLGAN